MFGMSNREAANGFTLLEALIASALLAGALVTLASLVSAGLAQSASMRRTIAAVVLAQSKLEELRALPWRFAADGSRISSAALAPSPPASLSTDAMGWVEPLDRFGANPSPGRPQTYRRRWSIAPWQTDPDTLVLQVCVFASSEAAVAGVAEACVAAIRTRKP